MAGEISPSHVDRRVEIAGAAILGALTSRGVSEGHYGRCGAMTPLPDGGICPRCRLASDLARSAVAALDADLADPDTERRMARAIVPPETWGVNDETWQSKIRLALAAWRGDA